MNIIIGAQNLSEIRDKYTVLELDTIRVQPDADPVTAYCVVESVTLDQIPMLQEYLVMHQDLITNYRARNWDFCQQAVATLRGKWGGEADGFYDEIESRVQGFRVNDPGPDWNGILDRTNG